jgi:hypothetical protein
LESIKSVIPQKNICQFCQTNIKSGEDFILCPSCSSSYHTECWYENCGCAVYGCGYKFDNIANNSNTFNINDILINAEYFINRKQYTEAINECGRILNIYPDNIDAKKLFNKATASLNIRLKIIADADEAFFRKDFTAAAGYYKNALLYLPDSEYHTVNAKLLAAENAMPIAKRKMFYRKMLVSSLAAIAFLSVLFLVYYFIFLEEDREFYSISGDDNTEDILSIETQIYRYEHFIRKFESGKLRQKANEKITLLASSLIQKIYKEDWKTSLKYLNKIDENVNPKLKKDLFTLIYQTAESEFFTNISSAKNLNIKKKYNEAKTQTENAIYIANYFPGTEMEKEKVKLNSNLNLLGKKISYLVKYKDIEKELNEKLDELKRTKEIESGNLVKINAIITEEKNPTFFLAKNIFDNNLIALKTSDITYYKKGDVVILECKKSGKINIGDDKIGEVNIPLYKFGNSQKDINSNSAYDLESLVQRLDYLKSQKSKIDSLLSLGL